MNKRITSILLCLVMTILLSANAMPIFAAPGDSGVSASVTEVSPGDEFTVTLRFPGVDKLICALQGKVHFDLDHFEVVEYKAPTLEGMNMMQSSVSDANKPTNAFFSATYDTVTSDADVSFAGLELTAKFRVKDGTPAGSYSFDMDTTCKIDSLTDLGTPDTLFVYNDFTNKSVTVKVVSAPKPATAIELNKTSLTLTVGSSEALTATVTPADSTDTVTWSSSNAGVASVDASGKVSAVAPGTATITAKAGDKTATCTVKVETAPCVHNYNKEVKSADALKSAGTCKDNAVYYYSCANCGAVERNDSHTFLGDKDATNHVGGTYLNDKKDATCKDAGYTGDTYCSGCNVKLSSGTATAKASHTPASTWSHDDSKHWKECTNAAGCGTRLEEAAHKSTGANAANCQHKAKCDVCGKEYGTTAAHDPASAWTSDASGHWHVCNTSGCSEKLSFAAHTPDHTGHATEEYAIKCTICGYVIEAQLAHTHVYDKLVATDAYKASDATCIAKAKYYKSCACGEHGTETFESGALAAHTPGTEWKSDETNHWHVCSVAGCGAVIDSTKAAHTSTGANAANCQHKAKCDVCGKEYGTTAAHAPATAWTSDASGHWHACNTSGCTEKLSFAAHTPDHTGHATEEYAIKCTICGYVIEAQLGHTHVYDKLVATDAYKASDATCIAKAKYYKSCACGDHGTETFESGALAAHTPGTEWKSDETNHWHVCSVAGCGAVIDSTKAAHTSTGANAANCQHKAKCDVCGKEYGTTAAHDPATAWTSDASGHWHACKTSGCTEKLSFAAHTPDHTGHATADYAIKCSICGYEIEAQLGGHTHVFNKTYATDTYKASDATCSAKARYYKSCVCGEKGIETFEAGELAPHSWKDATCTSPKTCTNCGATEGNALGHTEGTEWKSDKNNHWHVCSVAGCGAVVESSKKAHTPDRTEATATDPIKCSVCGYVIAPVTSHTHNADTTKFDSDENNHWNSCDGCNEKLNTAAHEFEWKIDKQATASEKGLKHEECKVCGYKKADVEIPATGEDTKPADDTTKPADDTTKPDDEKPEKKSNVALWIILPVVGCGAIAGVSVVCIRKKKSGK